MTIRDTEYIHFTYAHKNTNRAVTNVVCLCMYWRGAPAPNYGISIMEGGIMQ